MATTNIPEISNLRISQDWIRNIGPWIFAIIVILCYSVFLKYLVMNANPKNVGDDYWIRLTYLFGSLEAIAFSAVGFIFGKEVSRSRALTAEENARRSDQETREAKKVNREMLKEIYDNLPSTPPADSYTTPTESQTVEGIRKLIGNYIIKS